MAVLVGGAGWGLGGGGASGGAHRRRPVVVVFVPASPPAANTAATSGRPAADAVVIVTAIVVTAAAAGSQEARGAADASVGRARIPKAKRLAVAGAAAAAAVANGRVAHHKVPVIGVNLCSCRRRWPRRVPLPPLRNVDLVGGAQIKCLLGNLCKGIVVVHRRVRARGAVDGVPSIGEAINSLCEVRLERWGQVDRGAGEHS